MSIQDVMGVPFPGTRADSPRAHQGPLLTKIESSMAAFKQVVGSPVPATHAAAALKYLFDQKRDAVAKNPGMLSEEAERAGASEFVVCFATKACIPLSFSPCLTS